MPKELKIGIKLAIKAVGGHRKLARLLGISHQAIGQWDRIPAERLIEIEILTGVLRELLRPDLYRGFKRKAASEEEQAKFRNKNNLMR